MDIDEDDDFYAPEEAEAPDASIKRNEQQSKVDEKPPHELEEGEEEDQEGAMDEDDDSVSFAGACSQFSHLLLTYHQDIDIITERKDGSTSAPAAQ
jgi:pre-mRNA 3'-end-processing factor FIP1